jgi:ParB family chromosome partitioning protein
MAKTFAPRVKKRERKTIDLTERLGRDVSKISDQKLLQGAKISEIALKDIVVKSQVRTKFNDSSIKDLAANIKANGLIQPLVLHKSGRKYTLICGERRFRAMSSIKMKTAPCFILEDKTEEELMAIQFSENSSRESLHYIDRADGILNYQKATKASERKICAALGISKSEVHRSLIIAKLSKKIKEAAKKHNTEKYVLVEFFALDSGTLRTSIEKKIVSGEIVKRAQLKKHLASGVVKAGKKTTTRRKTAAKPYLPPGLSANAFLKAMNTQSKNLGLDAKTQKALKALLEETRDMID